MSISEGDIYNNVESYRNSNNLSMEKMADLMGLKSKQAYLRMIQGKTMKVKYIINLVNNTGINPSHFFEQSTKYHQNTEKQYRPPEAVDEIVSDKRGSYHGCINCADKEQTISAQRETITAQRETIKTLERLVAALEGNRRKPNGTSG